MGYASFRSTGDISGSHLAHGAMTLDSTWNDWDLSAIIPDGANVVLISCEQVNTTVTKKLAFRKNGHTNTEPRAVHSHAVANVLETWEAVVEVDANRVIEYFATGTAGTWTSIALYVRGYWF